MLPEEAWKGVLGREMRAIFTGHVRSINHINIAIFLSACHDYSAKILRVSYRTYVSTWLPPYRWGWVDGGRYLLEEWAVNRTSGISLV